MEAIPLKRVDTKMTCQALMQVFACFGVPEVILTDNGGNFTAAVTEELLKHLQCSHITSSPYYPQSNGMVERANGIIEKVLDKIAAGKSKTRWKELLPAMLVAVRTAKHCKAWYDKGAVEDPLQVDDQHLRMQRFKPLQPWTD